MNCPKCGGEVAQEEYIWFDGESIHITKCQSCGFFAAGATQDESEKIFLKGGIERKNND